MEYRGYTIQKDCRNPYSAKPEFMFYPTSDGVQHDADCDEDGYFYCGNCKWEDSIEEVKWKIDEIYFVDQEYKVRGVIFKWLSDAMQYIKQYGGELECRYQFDSI